MPWTIEHLYIFGDHDVVVYPDLTSHCKRRIVPDSDVIAYKKAGLFRVPNRENKAALPVDGDVIPYDQPALALDPVNKHSGMHVASIFSAVRL